MKGWSTKMTEREIYSAMIDGTIDAEVMKEFAEKKIAQLDKRNATAKVRAAKKRAEGDALIEQILAVLSDEPMSRDDVVNALLDNGIETTPGKVGYRLTTLSKPEDGRVTKLEATVGGEDGGRARHLMVYTLAE